MGKIIGVVALKGGVGKTTVAVNLGSTISSYFNKKVLVVDANFSTPHLGIHLGIINPTHTLHQVLNDKYSIYEAIYQHSLGFHVIPGKVSKEEVNIKSLKEKILPLKEIYDFIILDSSPSLNYEMAYTMHTSDEIIVVSSPDYPTLSSTIHAVNIARQNNVPIKGIVINKVRNKRFELSSKDISIASGTDILARLEDNVKVLESLSKMLPIVNYAPREKITKDYKKLAAEIIGEKYKESKLSKLKKIIGLNKKEV